MSEPLQIEGVHDAVSIFLKALEKELHREIDNIEERGELFRQFNDWLSERNDEII